MNGVNVLFEPQISSVMCNIVRDNGYRLDAVFVQIFPAFINIPHAKWKSKKIQK